MTTKDVTLIARNPLEMEKSHEGMIVWCQGRLRKLSKERLELGQQLKIAQKRKWRVSSEQPLIG